MSTFGIAASMAGIARGSPIASSTSIAAFIPWYVFGGAAATLPNRSAFGPNQSRRLAAFTDGLSNTLLGRGEGLYAGVPRLRCRAAARPGQPRRVP